jgi:hypothetical protein
MYGENLQYYDVNSLYPLAMTKPMPLKITAWHSNLNDIKLEDFFGFAKCIVECPKNIKIPLLPYRNLNVHSAATIHPTGRWTGTYFSEELKEVVKHGWPPIQGAHRYAQLSGSQMHHIEATEAHQASNLTTSHLPW